MMPRFLHKLLFSGGPVAVGVLSLSLLSAACSRRAPHAPRRPLPPPTVPQAPPPREEAKISPELVADRPAAPQLSEAERKAAARAAFAEGVQLQERSDCAHALSRFETAERLYDAPTHLLHIAQCQAATGRLVEAQESYSTLGHLTLASQAPEAFREAQEAGRFELARLKPRIPTLRLETSPPATSFKVVVVQINGTQLPSDLVGVARPMNPGTYHVTVTTGAGRSASGDVEIKEGDAKSLELRLSH